MSLLSVSLILSCLTFSGLTSSELSFRRRKIVRWESYRVSFVTHTFSSDATVPARSVVPVPSTSVLVNASMTIIERRAEPSFFARKSPLSRRKLQNSKPTHRLAYNLPLSMIAPLPNPQIPSTATLPLEVDLQTP